MHIYHTNHTHIHSAVQNLQHAISHLQKADKEAYIAEAVRTCHEHTENGIKDDLLRLIEKPSDNEAFCRMMQAISEVKGALADMEKVADYYRNKEKGEQLPL
jgi:formiminotetrahydrofolate cyclodeaminase